VSEEGGLAVLIVVSEDFNSKSRFDLNTDDVALDEAD